MKEKKTQLFICYEKMVRSQLICASCDVTFDYIQYVTCIADSQNEHDRIGRNSLKRKMRITPDHDSVRSTHITSFKISSSFVSNKLQQTVESLLPHTNIDCTLFILFRHAIRLRSIHTTSQHYRRLMFTQIELINGWKNAWMLFKWYGCVNRMWIQRSSSCKNGTYQQIRCGCMFEMRALNKLYGKRKTSRIRQERKKTVQKFNNV